MEKQANLKDWRKAKSLKQEELAAKLGAGQSTYQSWEAGRTSIPAEVQTKLRRMGYDGPWPQAEAKAGPAPREDYEAMDRRLKVLEAAFQALAPLASAVKDLDERVQAVERGEGPT